MHAKTEFRATIIDKRKLSKGSLVRCDSNEKKTHPLFFFFCGGGGGGGEAGGGWLRTKCSCEVLHRL